MHVKALWELPYLIPVFLLALCFSPNFTSSNIQQAALSCLVITGPIVAWTGSLARDEGSISFSDKRIFLIICFFLLAIWWNLDNPVFIVSLGLIMLVSYLFRGKESLNRDIIISMIFFIICYLQLNAFGIGQILNMRFAVLLLIPIGYPLLYNRRYELRFGYLVFTLGFAIVALRSGTLNHTLALIPVILPRIIMEMRNGQNKGLTDIMTGVLLAGFSIYYFLFADHVWQALTGGL